MLQGNGRSLGTRTTSGAVTVVEVSVARSYARRSRVAFYAVAFLGLPTGVVAGTFTNGAHRLVVIVAGIVAGVLAGWVVAGAVTAWPVLRSLWHWAPEIGLVVGVAFGWAALADATTPGLALLLTAGLAGGAAAVGPVRRRFVATLWCAVVRHRLRLCFAEFVRATSRMHSANPPLILAARPTPAGERVWVWLRPGLDLADLEAKTDKLAVACWASEVRVVRASARYAALIRIDVTRRDPLAVTVSSPLVDLVPDDVLVEAPVSPGMPPLGLDLPDVPEVAPEPRGARR
jgi:hypothetical protein